MAKMSWSDASAKQKSLVVLAAAAEAVLTTVAVRDLRSRPDDAIRGSKRLWRLAVLVQPVGPVAYLVAGRRS